MTKSRKFFLAATLLAGGYGFALLLSSITDQLAGNHSGEVGHSQSNWVMTTLRGFVSAEPSTGPAKLVPDIAASDDRPTWLAATPPTATVMVSSQPSAAAAPVLTESQPIAVPSAPNQVAGAAGPVARITHVTLPNPDRTAETNSPWDRWPRWGTSAEHNSTRLVPATFESAAAAPARAVPATFAATTDEETNPLLRRHVVIDGDSLELLADRYLDDRQRGNEIYRLNREVLTNPELLPIGVELTIPNRQPADSSIALEEPHVVQAAKPTTPGGMIPVEWSPKPFDAEPRAQLLKPISVERD